MDAWPIAVPAPQPHGANVSIRNALAETRRSWERAYVGEPPTDAERAATIVFSSWALREAEDRAEIVGVRCG